MIAILLVGLSLSIGWGIRGNFGHEYGAMIPGVLATLAAVLLAGREDWHRRGVFFGFFGALGWSFGGSMSYMQVIGYTHSGHSVSVLYGFASLFLIGFLWATMGGAGSALAAYLDRERLTEFFGPLTVIFAGWALQDAAIAYWLPVDSAYRQQSPLYWYDSDWLAALVALVAVAGWTLVRGRVDFASSLILHMAVGWWTGFLVLVNLLGWRMTPPRGDNWAGCVGMVGGMWVCFQRYGLQGLTFSSLVTGVIGGLGFATADALKLMGIATGWQTNWHSLLEQSYGFINGIGLAVALFWVARNTPKIADEPGGRRWAEPYAAVFVLVLVTYLNLSKNPETWVRAKAMPDMLEGLSAGAWFNLAYGLLACAIVLLLAMHQRRPLAFLVVSPLGRVQLLYLVFLWWMVIGNFERALVSFAPVRLVTEGIIFLNAVVCSVGILLKAPAESSGWVTLHISWARLLPKTVAAGCAAMVLSVLADWAMVRTVYGNRFAGNAEKHIRFGPDATATKEKPRSDLPHP
jgi:hypothetical protein